MGIEMTQLADINTDADVVAFVAGTLESERLASFEQRLADEPKLALAVAEERALRSRLNNPAGELVVPSDESLAALLTRVSGDAPVPARRSQWLAQAASVLALAVAAGLYLWEPGREAEYVGLAGEPATALTVMTVSTSGADAAALPGLVGESFVSAREQMPGVWQLIVTGLPEPELVDRLEAAGFDVSTAPAAER